MNISLRCANEADMAFLLALRDKTMRCYLEEAGMPTSPEENEKRIRYEFADARIVELDGHSVGLFKATYDQESNYWRLVQIQIDPEYQGQKIGSALIRDLIAKAKESGAKVGLSVISTNPAKHLYLKLGFTVVDASEAEHKMELQA